MSSSRLLKVDTKTRGRVKTKHNTTDIERGLEKNYLNVDKVLKSLTTSNSHVPIINFRLYIFHDNPENSAIDDSTILTLPCHLVNYMLFAYPSGLYPFFFQALPSVLVFIDLDNNRLQLTFC